MRLADDVQRVHFNCLYTIHRRNRVILEGEPMTCDVQKLIGFKTHATYARTSILEFNAVLRNKQGELATGNEVTQDLGIEEDTVRSGSISRASPPRADNHEGKSCLSSEVKRRAETEITRSFIYLDRPLAPSSTEATDQNTSTDSFLSMQRYPTETQRALHDKQQYPTTQIQPSSSSRTASEIQNPTLDIFQPFFDPAMLDLFPNGDIPDLSRFEVNPLSLDYFELDGWQQDQNISTNPQY